MTAHQVADRVQRSLSKEKQVVEEFKHRMKVDLMMMMMVVVVTMMMMVVAYTKNTKEGFSYWQILQVIVIIMLVSVQVYLKN